MTKRQIFLLSSTVLLFVATILFDLYIQRTVNLGKYAREIEAHMQAQEAEVEQFFADKSFIQRLLLKPETYRQNTSPEIQAKDFRRIETLSRKKYTLTLFQNGKLTFWNNNLVTPFRDDLRKDSPERETRFMQHRNGKYLLSKQTIISGNNDNYTIAALVPIKYEYELESQYLKSYYTASGSIPKEVVLTEEVTDTPVKSVNGETIVYLTATDSLVDRGQLSRLLILYVISFVLLALCINMQAKRLMIKHRRWPWLGAAFIIVSVFGLRLLSLAFDFTDRFSDLPLFAKNFNTTLSSSLGDLLINILLLLWVMIFFHKESRLRSFDHLSNTVKFTLTTLNYFSILIGILIITSVFRTLVFNTNIVFDFDNVFNLDRFSLIAIIGVILLLIALFMFSHRMMLAIVKIGMSRHNRLIALGIATLCIAPFLMAAQLMLPTIYLLLIAFVFILIFDLFIDSKAVNFTWLVIWLVILSAFPSILLFKYNAYKDRVTRISYARELANLQDTIAENAFIQLKNKIQSDNFLRREISRPFMIKYDRDKIKRQIDKFYTNDNYLFYNYEFDLSAFNRQRSAAIKYQENNYEYFRQKLVSGKRTSDDQLSFFNSMNDKSSYIMEVSLPIRNNPSNPLSLFLEFKRNRREQSKVYTELLVDKQYKNLPDLSKYEYAIYQNLKKIDSEGGDYGPILQLSPEDFPARGVSKEIIRNRRSEMVYHAPNGIVVILGKEKELFIKAISLFSYIFGMLIALVLVFAVINTFTRILPQTLSFSLTKKPSLKNRIQLSVIVLIVTSFIIIGFVTVWFFQNSSEEYHEKRLERKTQSVLTDAMHEIEILISNGDSLLNLAEIVQPISEVHRMDINLYDLDGRLISSSEEDIFNKGIVSRRMGAVAYRALTSTKSAEYIQEDEHVGQLTYKAAYVPLMIKTETGEKPLGFMGLPYYSKNSKLRSDVTVFMSTLLNVYVFLLLIAGGIAIAVANSITRPLAKIGEKLKQVKIGMRNEPLEWKNQDELGELIAEYNRMIKKLEESADKLAQSEREGAWREMAKQVAHEIKNPLTPMKLSIQYLQHAFRSNIDNIEPLLQRVSSTLIEQIDNLAQIASEFSNFAKMPRAENQRIVLNQLVNSVFELFSKEGQNMDLSLSVPKDQFMVYADKNHLMRVLNNLIKNAIQAIPDDRVGRVQVMLYRKDNQAIIKVSDNGTGIPEDKRDKVFVPNFTTKSSGTGLGLAISKNIIESVNGEIYFETVVNKGTDFFVVLPLVEVNQLEEVE
ncbi:MAG: ATP-binding protein [Bacteroidota bacterium]